MSQTTGSNEMVPELYVSVSAATGSVGGVSVTEGSVISAGSITISVLAETRDIDMIS